MAGGLWCWRCRMVVPMLDENDPIKPVRLYKSAFVNGNLDGMRSLLDYYNNLTGFNETEPNAIMHHFLHLYGPP